MSRERHGSRVIDVDLDEIGIVLRAMTKDRLAISIVLHAITKDRHKDRLDCDVNVSIRARSGGRGTPAEPFGHERTAIRSARRSTRLRVRVVSRISKS
jgi:hypothetical protein